jgi:hypothetical protein
VESKKATTLLHGYAKNKFISVVGRAAARNVRGSVSIVSIVAAAINFSASYNAPYLAQQLY